MDNELIAELLKYGISTNKIVEKNSLKKFRDHILIHLNNIVGNNYTVSNSIDIQIAETVSEPNNGFSLFLMCKTSELILVGLKIENHGIFFINGDSCAILLDYNESINFVLEAVKFCKDYDGKMPMYLKKSFSDNNKKYSESDFDWL